MNDFQDLEERLERARERARSNRWQDVILSLSQAGPEIDEFPEALSLLAEAFYRQGQHLKSQETCGRAFLAYEQRGERGGMWRSLNLSGLASFELGEFTLAEERFNRALSILETLEEPGKLAVLWNNLGMLNAVQERLEEALRCYERSLEISKVAGDVTLQMHATHNRGMGYRDLKQWDLADQCFADACRLAQAAQSVVTLAQGITERAHIARHKGNRAQAEQMARMAMMRFDTLSYSAGLGEVYKLLGALARERGAWLESEEYLEKAREQNALLSTPLLGAEIEQEAGLLLRDQGQMEEARRVLKEAADSFDSLGRKAQAEETRALLLLPPPALG